MTQFETARLICHSFISPPVPYTSPIQYLTLCNVPFHTFHRSVMPRWTCVSLAVCSFLWQGHPGGHIKGATVQVSCYRMIVETVKQEKCPLCNLFLCLTFGPSLWQHCQGVSHLLRRYLYLCIFLLLCQTINVFLSNPLFYFALFFFSPPASAI